MTDQTRSRDSLAFHSLAEIVACLAKPLTGASWLPSGHQWDFTFAQCRIPIFNQHSGVRYLKVTFIFEFRVHSKTKRDTKRLKNSERSSVSSCPLPCPWGNPTYVNISYSLLQSMQQSACPACLLYLLTHASSFHESFPEI